MVNLATVYQDTRVTEKKNKHLPNQTTNKRLYLDMERAFDPERDLEDADFERDLERRDDLCLGDLLQVDLLH